MTALPEAMRELAGKIAGAVQAVVPPLFRGIVRITVDNGRVYAHDVSVEYRPPQPRAGERVS